MSAQRFALAAPAVLHQEIRKSRFVAQAQRIDSIDSAFAFVARVRDASASHNCWAYRIAQQYRFSDDGEPAGTAGKPILQAIDAQGFDETVVVVTRWFGGIKLGAGGLARAYGGSAAECLRVAARIELTECVRVEFSLPFSALTLMQARLADLRASKTGELFDADGAMLELVLPADRVSALRSWLADTTRGRSELTVLD